MTAIDGNTLEGVSATTLWTLHNRGTEAKRSDGVIRDPWAVTLFDTISYTIPGVSAARDIPLPPGRGAFKVAAWPPLDRVGFLRRNRPSITLLEFGR